MHIKIKSSNPPISFTATLVFIAIGVQNTYVAQGIECDICVQGSSIKNLKERMIKALKGHVYISELCGTEPFCKLPPTDRHDSL
jgi:hypothetical protein